MLEEDLKSGILETRPKNLCRTWWRWTARRRKGRRDIKNLSKRDEEEVTERKVSGEGWMGRNS